MDQTSVPSESSPTATPPAPTMSLTARLFNVFATPGEVFDQIKPAAPRAANWLAPAILLILLSWVSAVLVFSQPSIRQQMSDLANKAIDQQVEKGKMTSSQADQARGIAEKWGTLGYKIGGFAAPVFLGFALPFWWGLILWLGGAKVMKGGFPFMKAVEAAGLANMVMVLDVVVRTLLIMVTGNLFASASLALFVKDFDPQNTMHGLLSLVNVMVFWMLAVRAIGMARLAGVSFGKAAVWVFGIWAAYTGVFMGLGAALKAVMGR